MAHATSTETKVKDLAFSLAVSLVNYLKGIRTSPVELELIRQLTRSGTSIGANVEEGEGARTRPEFINSMNIAKREARETVYWLRLLAVARGDDQKVLQDLLAQAEALLRMLTAIVKTSEHRRF